MTNPKLLPDESVIFWRDNSQITRQKMICDAQTLSQRLCRDGGSVLNLATDRYYFSLLLLAASLVGKTAFLPQDRAPNSIKTLESRYSPITSWKNEDVADLLASASAEPSVVEALDFEAGFEADLVAITAFTSGSTGVPKAQDKTWPSLYQYLSVLNERLFDTQRKNFVSTVPAQHVYGLELSILFPLFFGHSCYTGKTFYPQDIKEALERMPSARVLVTVPVHLRACVESNIEWPEIDLIISATAPLDKELAIKAEKVFNAPLIEQYGSTETGAVATRRITQGSLWKPLRGIALYHDESEQVYVKAEHLSCATPMHDAIDIFPDGFALLSRQQELIKVGGKRALLSELNFRLQGIKGVQDGVFFVPEKTGQKEKRLAALVVAPELDAQFILDELREYLDYVFLPRPLKFVDKLPRTETGKLVRNDILALFKNTKS